MVVQAELIDAEGVIIADASGCALLRGDRTWEVAASSDARLIAPAPAIVRQVQPVREVPADGKPCRARQ